MIALVLNSSILIGQNYYMASPEGFGAATTGGGNATPVTVSTYADLKAKLASATPQVILVSGTIEFSATELQISEVVTNKSIIGLPGARLINNKQTQSGSGILNLKSGSSNVIIRNLIFEGPGAYDTDGRDNLTSDGCINLWVDHCEFQDGIDGNFDIKGTSDNVTVSWCKFTYKKPAIPGGPGGSADHRFSNLVGSSSTDAPADGHYSVTFQNCYWADGVKSRMPRARNAELHILNSYYNTSVAGASALGLGGGINNLTCYVENSNFANVSTVYSNASGDGGTVSLQFDGCINGVANVGTVAKPTYSYTVLPVNDVATYIPNASCGAGANLQVNTAGEISTSCDNAGQPSNSTLYNLADESTFTHTGTQWDPVTSTTSPDGKVRTQAATSLWHSTGYGVAFKDGNSLEIDVSGHATVRFYGSVYSAGTMNGGTTVGGSELGSMDVKVAVDKTGFYEFNYVGGPKTLYFTFSGSNAYTPAIEVISPTTTYDLRDESTFTHTGTQWDPVTSTTSPDGKVRTQAATSQWHSTGYGVAFKNGNSLEIDVDGSFSTVRFYGSIYSAGTMSGGTTPGGSELGTADVKVAVDKTGFYEFNYTGGPRTLYFTFSGSNAYTPAIEVTNLTVSVAKTDVWDFGAALLDETLYNNKLTESVINSFYTYVDPQVPGESGRNISSFNAGDLGYVTNSTTSDRLRTTNLNLTRWDSNIASSVNFTGRLYVNSGANIGRYLTLNLNEDDEVTIEGRTDAGGTFNFVFTADPAAQTDQVVVPAAETTIKFVAKQAGEYHVFDTSGKPSYFRVYRKAAVYKTLTGIVDETNAPGIPAGYSVNFTNTAGKTFSTVVSGGAYSIDLPIEYTYTLSLSGANGYLIGNGLNLNVTAETITHDIQVLQVTLYNVSGNITGLSDLSNLELTYTPDPAANKIYNPIITIDSGTLTYSVDLEADVEYTISAEGVNDYEISANTITITGDQTADINFTPKPVYNITLNTQDLDVTQRGLVNLTFNNLNEEGYSYSFADISTVQLRDGVYSVNYDSGLDAYPLEMALTSNLTVTGADTSKDLEFKPVTEWVFRDRTISNATAYKGLLFTGNINVRGGSGDLNAGSGATIAIPVKVGDKVILKDYYASNYSIEGGPTISNTSNSTSVNVVAEYVYLGTTDGYVNIAVGGTTYFVSIKTVSITPFSPVITVGTDKDYQTINEALNAISRMDRPNDERVTVMIDPGNYEEMLVISSPNVTLKNAGSVPSIGLLNKGVDIEAEAVRITSYYGQKYNFFSQGVDNKWHADVLAVNKANGYTTYVNKEGTGSGSSYWNATVVVESTGLVIEDIILENSFNQYISQKESEDVVQAKNPDSDPTRPADYGNTAVQNRGAGYVTQAAAIGIAASADKIILNNCRVIGRQDSFYGAAPARVVVYKGAMMGAVDYIFGAMDAVFYKTDFVLNTSDYSSDEAYITAAQQTSGRGYLMYEGRVISPIPGVETASTFGSKPGYFGRPWAPNTSEVVFYNTTIDKSTYPGYEDMSLIYPIGWRNTLSGESPKMYEYGTIEVSGVDNSGNRATWSTVLTSPTLTDGTEITTFNFTKGNDGWDPIPLLDAEEDSDYDGIPDVNDNCPFNANPDQADFNNNGIGDVCEDTDGDGLMDNEDSCPNSPVGAVIDVFGCEVFELPADNFSVVSTAVSCNGQNDGSISITSQNTDHTYNVTVDGAGSTSFTSTTTLEGLSAGIYRVCITIEGRDNYEQCFYITVEGPSPLEAYSSINYTDNIVNLTMTGANLYHIIHNGEEMTTSSSSVAIDLKSGQNTIEVSTDFDCQGTYFENIFISEKVAVFPNPTKGNLQVFINGKDKTVELSLFDVVGKQYMSSNKDVSTNRTLDLDITKLSNGVYFLLLNSETVRESIKIIKN